MRTYGRASCPMVIADTPAPSTSPGSALRSMTRPLTGASSTRSRGGKGGGALGGVELLSADRAALRQRGHALEILSGARRFRFGRAQVGFRSPELRGTRSRLEIA